ncbi:hypothetical protein K469DRAFT_588342 [Zopfia rhizophila CBS 207.26]|uniref:Uncharacterized protein n=1 Tax=Zopfia rhizophila CBS 207.26 TaxID=1314779 RepID=A0A6A6DTK2_9PEZI|nr:hypothetical protein K469DRAFT_588342 [Zopfia rhizophila CBS 207.26]
MKTLPELPAEIVDRIAQHLLGPYDYFERIKWPHGKTKYLASLRLTCRSLAQNIQYSFIRAGFTHHFVDFSMEGLMTLQMIAMHPLFGPRVEVLHFRRYEVAADMYNSRLRDMKQLQDSGEDEERLDRCIRWVEDWEQDMRDRSFIERSGICNSMLYLAFSVLPNVREIHILAAYRAQGSVGLRQEMSPSEHGEGSTTIMWSAIFQAVLLSRMQLKLLNIFPRNYRVQYGISIQALDMPEYLLKKLGHVQEIRLLLNAQDQSFGYSQSWWPSLPARFLGFMPSLVKLNLAFDNWDETERIMERLRTVHWKQLEAMKFQGIQCTKDDLYQLFTNHRSTLRYVKLSNSHLLDGTWLDVLKSMDQLTRLFKLKLNQLAQDELRVCFPRLGYINHYNDQPLHDDDFSDWVFVSKLQRYRVEVDDEGNMAVHLRELQVGADSSTRRTRNPDLF